MFLDIVHSPCSSRKQKGWCDPEIANLDKMIENMKSCTFKQFGLHYDLGILTLKFHRLDHLGED